MLTFWWSLDLAADFVTFAIAFAAVVAIAAHVQRARAGGKRRRRRVRPRAAHRRGRQK